METKTITATATKEIEAISSVSSVMNFIETLTKGAGVNVKISTIPTMRKTNNPFIGRIAKITEYSGVVLGVRYMSKINGSISRSGNTNEYEPNAPKGSHRFNDFLYQSDKDETIFYLNIMWVKKQMGNLVRTKVNYLVDNRLITENEKQLLDTFLPVKNYDCAKQLENGIDDLEQICVNRPKLSNVLSIKQGEKIWSRN